MTDNKAAMREAALVMSDLLCSTLQCKQRHLYGWEVRAMDWIVEQRKCDNGTVINAWTSDRIAEYERGEPVRCLDPSA